jgi:DNA polymerase-3 subunit delta'
MSDEILSPRDNPDLIGQDAAEQSFIQAWNSGRLAHAWLITGPKGIGKATLAMRIARFVLSGGGETSGGGLFGDVPPASLQMSPDHPVFRRIASGGHADFKLIERGWSDDKKTKRKSEITVDDVRDIGSFMSLTPAEGGWRVVVVDAADEMNRNSANAILKVLEEPPKRALMLLLAHSPGRLLPTIRSRCRRLTVPPLSHDTVIELLRRHHPDMPADTLQGLAALGEGSIGRALALHEQGGMDLYGSMVGLLNGLPKLPGGALHDFAEKVGRQADSVALFGELFAGWLAQGARRAAGGPGSEVVAGEANLQRRLVTRVGLERWTVLWERISTLFDRADAVNLDGKQVILNAFLAVEKACR